MELIITSLTPTPGSAPDSGIDSYGNTYYDFALTEESNFTFVVPVEYSAGEDITILINENSASLSKAHKWKITSTIALTHSQYEYVSFTSSGVSRFLSQRTVTISTSGQIGNYTIEAGATVAVKIQRLQADSNEDPEDVRIYSIVVKMATTDEVQTTCLGRVGSVVSSVLMVLNDDKQRFITQTEIVSWINEVILEIAQQGFWTKQTLIDVVANQESYYLPNLITDLERVIGVRWHDETTFKQYRDKLVPITTWQNYQDCMFNNAVATRAYRYYLDGNYLYPVPVPSADLTNGIAVYHSFCPDPVGCTTNYDLPVPKAHDNLFKWYALVMAYGRDRHSPMAQQSQQMYQGLLRGAMARLMSIKTRPGMRLRTNR